MSKRALAVLAAVFVVAISGCGAKESPQTGAQPGATKPNPYAEYDRSAKSLVDKEAKWQTSKDGMTVGQTERIGLAIGSGKELKEKIDALLPDTVPSSAGAPVQVGPMMRATLRANPADAEITPADAVNASTGSNIQMLWTWLVHPKRPTGNLQLTVLLEVPLDNGHTISNELALSLAVARTFAYTAQEVATHWGTWSAVVATLVSVGGWLFQRRRSRKSAAVSEGGTPEGGFAQGGISGGSVAGDSRLA